MEPCKNVHFRWMVRRDMPAVLAIENESFEFPWSEEDFITCLRERCNIGMIAQVDERVAGFFIFGLEKSSVAIRQDLSRQSQRSQM